ncbi:two-component sensor histidine kinase [Pigmentiphaga aceris]|uniref:histidine kinase n=1 Tax=Pigmentiphaga aceris TaxID=1940612 RepID=A0A5C0AUM3_9BURK|nr:ATP-binding protein [Pigmentiphaga aceris]QEI06112.1 two-component sensor histidine kinase [Pigmentiphaga aceris]
MNMLRSVRARLLVFLLAAIVLFAIVQAVVAYRSALSQADEMFDNHLQRTAVSLARGAPMSPALAGEEAGANDEDLLIQIWSAEGVRIYRSTRRIVLPEQIVLGMSTVTTAQASYRMYSVATPTRIIQVGQDLAVRQRLAGGFAWRAVLPTAAMAPLLMIIVWWVVGSSLAPVDRVRRQLAQRQPGDLPGIDEGDVPDEVRPMIAEMNLLFARVDRAFSAQRQFVGDAAHELRTPLTALKLQIDALSRAPDEAARARAVARLEEGVERARRLVEQLLSLARQEAAPVGTVVAANISLTDAVRLAIADAVPLAQARDIDLGMVRDDAAVAAIAPDALRMLLSNLLDNAIKYTSAGGRVDVGVANEPGACRVWVEDSGPGIPVRDRARVFERFVRLDGTSGEGTGLGLAIVKAIADREGIVVTLDESEALGGLRITLRFAAHGASPPGQAALG